jgi:hypothetical protein
MTPTTGPGQKYRTQAPCDIKEGEWFILDLDTGRVLMEAKTSMVGEVDADNVNRPAHYRRGKIEVIDFIEDQSLGYQLGNAVKYICRAGFKDPSKEVEDLSKARWYLNRRINNVVKTRQSQQFEKHDLIKKHVETVSGMDRR